MPRSNSANSIWVFILFGLLVICIALAFVTSDYIREASVSEAQKVESQMGASTLRKVNEMAGRWYLATIGEAKGEFNLDILLSDDPYSPEYEYAEMLFGRESTTVTWINARKEAFLDLAYWGMRRFALFIIWIPLWIPLIFLSIYHGYLDREIKKTDFGYTSPVLNHWARSTMWLVSMTTLMLFIAPIAINPFVFPLMMAVWAIAIGVAFGNIQKRI